MIDDDKDRAAFAVAAWVTAIVFIGGAAVLVFGLACAVARITGAV